MCNSTTNIVNWSVTTFMSRFIEQNIGSSSLLFSNWLFLFRLTQASNVVIGFIFMCSTKDPRMSWKLKSSQVGKDRKAKLTLQLVAHNVSDPAPIKVSIIAILFYLFEGEKEERKRIVIVTCACAYQSSEPSNDLYTHTKRTRRRKKKKKILSKKWKKKKSGWCHLWSVRRSIAQISRIRWGLQGHLWTALEWRYCAGECRDHVVQNQTRRYIAQGCWAWRKRYLGERSSTTAWGCCERRHLWRTGPTR